MTNFKCLIQGLFLVIFSLSTINVGHASRKLFQLQSSNGLEGLKKTLDEVQKLVISANPPREADLKQINSLLEQIRDLIPKPDSPKGLRRMLSTDSRYLAAVERLSSGYKSRNIAEVPPLLEYLPPKRPMGSHKVSDVPPPITRDMTTPPKLPNKNPHFPTRNGLPPPPSPPKSPSLSRPGNLPTSSPIFPKRGGFPPLPNSPKTPYHNSPNGLNSEPTNPKKAPMEKTAKDGQNTNPSTSAQVSAPKKKAPTNVEPTQNTKPSNAPPSRPGNTRIPSRLLLATPRHLLSTLNMEPRKLGDNMPQGIMSTETKNYMMNDGSGNFPVDLTGL